MPKLSSQDVSSKKKPRNGSAEVKLHTISGAKYMFGIGDQTFDSAKGLEALPNDLTIDIFNDSLKITFVKFCKPLKIKKPPVRMGYIRWGLQNT